VELFLLCGPAFRDFVGGRLGGRRCLRAGGGRHEQSENSRAHEVVHVGFLQKGWNETGE
jgi:hypothetical protein